MPSAVASGSPMTSRTDSGTATLPAGAPMLDRFLISTVNGADQWIRRHKVAAWTIWGVTFVSCLYVRWAHNV